MFVLRAMGLRKEWNGRTLFRNVDLTWARGERLALIGRNGSGKTTLLNGLLGKIAFDGGRLHREVPVHEWGVLEQEKEAPDGMTTMDFVQAGSPERFRLKQQLERLQVRMKDAEFVPSTGSAQSGKNGGSLSGSGAVRSDGSASKDASENVRNADLLEQYGELHDRFLELDGYNLETEAGKHLRQVELPPSVWEIPFNRLSGGQKTRAQIARLMMKNPACIVMDEPTNHLDREMIEWLENWLLQYPGAVLFVSHDRSFLDRTAQAVYELNPDGCKRYAGGYTDYRRQKERERRTLEAACRKQEQRRRELMEAIRRYQMWFRQAHKAAGQNDFARSKAKKNVSRFKAKETELERLNKERVRRPQVSKSVNMRLEADEFAARTLLRTEQLSFSYGEKTLFEHLNLTVNREDRIAVTGRNGSGKTTLLRLLVGELAPTKGTVTVHPQTKIGYFAQELGNLERDRTILDTLLTLPGMTQSEARTILGCFLFSREDVFKKIGDLSMGEKCRVAFLKLYFSRANLLILDEPTNFLDIETREALEDVLLAYPGALVIVSHDRYLLEKVSNRVVHLDEGSVIDYPGGYQEFRTKAETPGSGRQDPARDNERQRLELQLARLMAEAEDASAADRSERLEQIRDLKKKLERLGHS